MDPTEDEDEFASASEGEEEEFIEASGVAATAAASSSQDDFWEAGSDDEDGPADTIPGSMGACDLTAEDAMVGVNMFFSNRFTASEQFFDRAKNSIPVFSMAVGVLQAIKALMTFDSEDIKRALKQLQHAEKFASKLSGRNDGKLKKMFLIKSSKPTSEQVSARIVCAEARLAASLLYLLEESISGFLKAGLGVRAAWKGFEECRKLIEGPNGVSVSDSDRGAVEYGEGSFNMVLAMLPTSVLRMLEMIGFKGNLEHGLAELRKCLAGQGLRWPIAALVLLVHHVMLPSFLSCPQQMKQHIIEGDRILSICLERYPQGCLFQFILGRQMRLKGNLIESSRAFRCSLDSQSEWLQLQHICIYELAWNHMFSLEFGEAGLLWEKLLVENNWSKAFFAYMAATCMVMERRNADAALRFSQVASHVKRKIGGKIVSAEQFVVRKVNDLDLGNAESLENLPSRLLALEAIFLWNGFAVMTREALIASLRLVDESRSLPCPSHLAVDVKAVQTLIVGTVHKWLQNEVEAETLFKQATEVDLKHEVYVIPHSLYELGVMLLNNPDREEEAKRFLKSSQNFKKDYNFELRLKFRLHAASKLAKFQLHE